MSFVSPLPRRAARPRGVLAASLILALAFAPTQALASAANFESHQVHPLVLTPSGGRLLAVNTPDARLEIFGVSATGALTLQRSVRVGLEPVSVAARTDTEAWVVNNLSDSVSVVDLVSGVVLRTMRVGDEPTDVAFAAGRAFVTVSGEDRIRVFSATDASVAPIDVPIEGDLPRALAVSRDGASILLVVLHSGNRTTIVSADSAANEDSLLNAARLAALGLNDVDCSSPAPPYPPLPAGITRNPALIDPPSGVPRVGLIVRWNETLQKWEDDAGQDWTPCLQYRLPDDDLFIINATTLAVSTVRHLGTSLFDVSVNPANGKVYVPNTDALNFTRFEHELGVQGHIVDNRMSIVDLSAGNSVSIVDLNTHVNRSSSPPSNLAEREASISQPGAMAWRPDGSAAYLTAIGSRKLFIMNGGCTSGPCIFGANRAAPQAVEVGEGPTGVAFHAQSNLVFVLSRFENRVDVVDPTALSVVAGVPLHDASADIVRLARRFHYDGILSSAHGDSACSTCHISGDVDRLSWDLGNPEGDLVPYSAANDNVRFIRPTAGGSEPCDPADCSTHVGFDPQKGPMMTQTFRAMLEPLHWRGDRGTMNKFNPAFVGLLGAQDIGPVDGAPAGLSAADMEAFRQFSLAIRMPPNPYRNLDDTLPNTDIDIPQTDKQGNPSTGLTIFDTNLSDRGTTCVACHNHPFGSASGKLGGVPADEPTSMDAAALISAVPLHSEHNDLKVPHLRNIYQKSGPVFGTGGSTPNSKSGYGLTHNGSAPDILTFLCASNFNLSDANNAQEVRDVAAMVMLWPTGTNPCTGRNLTVPPGPAPTGSAEDEDLLNGLVPLSDASDAARQCELVVHAVVGGRVRGYRLVSGLWRPDDIDDPPLTSAQLRTTATSPLTYLAVLPGEGARVGNDRDEDGLLDSDDCAPDSALPCIDTDGDTILDTSDNCTTTPNPLQEDSDGDSVGNACDNCPAANPSQANSDGDTLGNACDNCPTVDNASQQNSDTDPQGDACDNCVVTDNSAQLNSDADLLGDACDNCVTTSNQAQTDGDGDSIGDACDACPSDATNDADADSVCQDVDNCPAIANPAQVNTDGDAAGDACDACANDATNDADGDGVCQDVDNCPAVANASQVNADGDAAGDACDACPNDATNDADGDGVCADADNCPVVSNASQANADGDAAGDACDACPNDAANDADGDGVCADADNCPAVANASQVNADGDATGDACDACPNDATNDADGDGACQDVDNCPALSNASQQNSDTDSFGDDCDVCPNVDDPLQLDSDGNGVGDACEPITSCSEPSALDLNAGVPAFRVAMDPAGLRISWEDVGAATYEVLGGPLSRLRAPSPVHDSLACGLTGSTALVTPRVDTQYLLIVSRCGAITSSAGRNSSSVERPTAATACP